LVVQLLVLLLLLVLLPPGVLPLLTVVG